MKFELSFEVNNSAYRCGEEEKINTFAVAETIKKVSERVARGDQSGGIKDYNGNTVGDFYFNPTADESSEDNLFI